MPLAASDFRGWCVNCTPPKGQTLIVKAPDISVAENAGAMSGQIDALVAAWGTLPRHRRGIHLVWPGTTFWRRDSNTKLAFWNGTGGYEDLRESLAAGLVSGTLDLTAIPDRLYNLADNLTQLDRLAPVAAAINAAGGLGAVITEGSQEYAYAPLDALAIARADPLYQAAVDAIAAEMGESVIDYDDLIDNDIDMRPAELTRAMRVMHASLYNLLIAAGWFTDADVQAGRTEFILFNSGLSAVSPEASTTAWANQFPRSTSPFPSIYLMQLRLNRDTGLTEPDQSTLAVAEQGAEIVSGFAAAGVAGRTRLKVNVDRGNYTLSEYAEFIEAERQLVAQMLDFGYTGMVYWAGSDSPTFTQALAEHVATIEGRLAPSTLRSSRVQVNFNDPTYRSMVLAHDPMLWVRFGKTSPENIVNPHTAAYVGSPVIGRPAAFFTESDANNVGAQFVNSTTTPANYGTIGGNVPGFGPLIGTKTVAVMVWFRCNNQTEITTIFGNRDANNGVYLRANCNGYLAENNYCEVILKRDNSNYRALWVNTGGKHRDGQWHCLTVIVDVDASKTVLLFDGGMDTFADGTYRFWETDTSKSVSTTNNNHESAGTLVGFGELNTRLLAGCRVGDGAGNPVQDNTNRDVEVAEVLFLTDNVSIGNVRALVLAALGDIRMGTYGVQVNAGIGRCVLAADTQPTALALITDSQGALGEAYSGDGFDRSWTNGFLRELDRTNRLLGVVGAAAQQGSFSNPYDGVTRGGVAASSYANYPADLKAIIYDHQQAITDPDNPGGGVDHTTANGVLGGPIVLIDGAELAHNSTPPHTYTLADTLFDWTGDLQLIVTYYGSTTGSGTGRIYLDLRNSAGSDVLARLTLNTKGPAPAGALVSGTWWRHYAVVDIPAGARASTAYNLYLARNDLGTTNGKSLGPGGIGYVQIVRKNAVGATVQVCNGKGGVPLRYTNRQLEDVGAARLAEHLYAIALPAIVQGKPPCVGVIIAHGFNDKNTGTNAVKPDASFPNRPTNTLDGLEQNFEFLLRLLDQARLINGWPIGSISGWVQYCPNPDDHLYRCTTYIAAQNVGRRRRADLSLTQLAVTVVPDLVVDVATEKANGNFLFDEPGPVHPSEAGFVRFVALNFGSLRAAIARAAGALPANGATGIRDGRVTRIIR